MDPDFGMDHSPIHPHHERIIGMLHALQRDQLYCDVNLETDGGTDLVMAHACVLAAASPLLRKHLSPHRPGITTVRTHLSKTALLGMVEYAYTGVTKSDVCEPRLLLSTAEQFGITLSVSSQHDAEKDGSDTTEASGQSAVKLEATSSQCNRQQVNLEKFCLEQILQLDASGTCSVVTERTNRSVPLLWDEVAPSDSVVDAAADEVKEELPPVVEDEQQEAGDGLELDKGLHDTSTDEYEPDESLEQSPVEEEYKPYKATSKRRGRHIKVTARRNKRRKATKVTAKEEGENKKVKKSPAMDETQEDTLNGQTETACEECDKKFASARLLRIHRRDHQKGVHKCSYCDEEFTALYLRTLHEQTHGLEDLNQDEGNPPVEETQDPGDCQEIEEFPCELCDRVFETKLKRKYHRRSHPKSPDMKGFPCEQCDKVFETKLKRKYHRRSHRRSIYKCSHCDKTFSIPYLLKVHERQHTGERPFSCNFCENSFTTRSGLNNHKRLHTGDCPFVCSFCSQSFPHKSSLVKHEAKHTGIKPYQCTHCGKSFVFNSYRVAHEKSHASIRAKPHSCTICQKAFAEKSELAVHIRRHTGETPYQCQYCPKMFASRRVLRSHEKTHRPEKPLKCPMCDKRFHTSSQVKSHERTHTGERPFQCSICGKCFSQRCGLNHHMRTHTGERPFPCSYCDKRFATKNKKEDHERIHTGDKPFHCHFCDKKFSQLSILKVHERIHTGERPFKCTYCGWRSITKQHLNKHEKTHLKGGGAAVGNTNVTTMTNQDAPPVGVNFLAGLVNLGEYTCSNK